MKLYSNENTLHTQTAAQRSLTNVTQSQEEPEGKNALLCPGSEQA